MNSIPSTSQFEGYTKQTKFPGQNNSGRLRVDSIPEIAGSLPVVARKSLRSLSSASISTSASSSFFSLSGVPGSPREISVISNLP